MKKQSERCVFVMERDLVLHGVHLGEHSFEADKMIEEIRERAVEKGLNFVEIRIASRLVPKETYIKWAKYMAENKIYFGFYILCSLQLPEETACLTKK